MKVRKEKGGRKNKKIIMRGWQEGRKEREKFKERKNGGWMDGWRERKKEKKNERKGPKIEKQRGSMEKDRLPVFDLQILGSIFHK